MHKHLYIITGSYPYDYSSEGTFLNEEVKLYSKFFDLFTFVPLRTDGNLYSLPFPFQANTELAVASKKKNRLLLFLYAFNERLFWQELVRVVLKGRLRFFRDFLSFTAEAVCVKRWLIKNIESGNTTKCYIYSYWSNHSALGAIFAFKGNKSFKILSRAHNVDLYEERSGYLPYQPAMIKSAQLMAPVSEQGKTYLRAKFPFSKDRISAFRLGVSIPEGYNSRPSKAIVVSCSSVTPVKRVELIYHSLCHFANLKKQEVSWHHFGAGGQFSDLRSLISDGNNSYLEVVLHGHVNNKKVLDFYRQQPISCFINVSEFEGIPVSIMEAQACGIPVIATNVGGNSEIVINGLTGRLISSSPTPEEVSNAFTDILERTEIDFLRQNSRTHCNQNFNAEINFSKFLNFISKD